MTGPKLNEGARVTGERAGTRATAKYLRFSASKARVVLDLIRGLPANQAVDVLKFSERGAARDVAKVLDSAIANAIANDMQDPDELYVSACFADEGPTLRRFRPRARGRATRIRKRTCHITVVVDRMSDRALEVLQQRDASRGAAGGGASARARRERVERSRQRAQALRQQAEEGDEELDESAADDLEEITSDEATAATDADETTDTDETTDADEATDTDETDEVEPAAAADQPADDDDADDGDTAATETTTTSDDDESEN